MKEPHYREHLDLIRDTFPAPVSDRKHDAYFVFSILRALDEVDDLKSEVPLLGRPRALDYAEAPTHARVRNCCATTTTTGGCSRYLYDCAMRGEGVHISMTDCYRETDYGEPIVGLKSFILSPFIDEQDVEQLVRDILDARHAIREAS